MMLSKMPMDETLRNNLLLAQGILSRSCGLAQKLSTANSITDMFRSSHLKRLVGLVDAAPEILETLVNAIAKEDLHEFIVNNQLPDLLRDFPAAFCDPRRPNGFSSFVNTSMKVQMAVNGICTTNWTDIVDDLMAEFIPLQTYVQMASPNSTLDLLLMLNKTECLFNAAMGIDWTRFIDIEKIMGIPKMLMMPG